MKEGIHYIIFDEHDDIKKIMNDYEFAVFNKSDMPERRQMIIAELSDIYNFVCQNIIESEKRNIKAVRIMSYILFDVFMNEGNENNFDLDKVLNGYKADGAIVDVNSYKKAVYRLKEKYRTQNEEKFTERVLH